MLQKGDPAPAFTGVDQFGNQIELENYRGKKVVLYFYPKDDTPGCTKEACNLRDNYQLLQEQGYVVIGVSPDSLASHEKFASKFNLPFSLIADTKLEIIKKYGAWGTKNMYGKLYEGLLRTTFIISESGAIEDVIKKVKTENHTQQIIH